MPEIVWIASYPKSGNTWVRFLLYAALFGPPERSLDVARKIPDIHRKLPYDQPTSGDMLIKTHFALSPKHPNLAHTRAAIHIVRHPRDILRSGLAYTRLRADLPDPPSAEQYAEHFIKQGGDPAWIAQGFGTWPQHVRTWRDQTRFPVCALRYEDMLADTASCARTLLAFLNLPADDETVQRAVAGASFDAMRALEVREKNDRKLKRGSSRLFVGDQSAARKGRFFVNQGRASDTLDDIAPGLDARLCEAFAEDLDRLGYA